MKYSLLILTSFCVLVACGDEGTRAPLTSTVPLKSTITGQVFFLKPSNNAVVPSTFKVAMATEGLVVEPAGEIHENGGHMHILVDTDFIKAGQVTPFTDQHLHFGDGSLETQLTLTSGTHTLRLQFANGAHAALNGDQYRDEITITVE